MSLYKMFPQSIITPTDVMFILKASAITCPKECVCKNNQVWMMIQASRKTFVDIHVLKKQILIIKDLHYRKEIPFGVSHLHQSTQFVWDLGFAIGCKNGCSLCCFWSWHRAARDTWWRFSISKSSVQHSVSTLQPSIFSRKDVPDVLEEAKEASKLFEG